MAESPIDPNGFSILTCECGNDIFIRGIVRKEVPSILMTKREPQVFQLEVLYCGQCGKFAPGYDNSYLIFKGQGAKSNIFKEESQSTLESNKMNLNG